MPGRDELEQLQTEVCSIEDLRKPVNLAQKLLSTPGMNKEVGSAMTELLQVCHCTLPHLGPAFIVTFCLARHLWHHQHCS